MKKLGMGILGLAIFAIVWFVGACAVAALGGGLILQVAWLLVAFKVSDRLGETLKD